jgi:hypothetical protein
MNPLAIVSSFLQIPSSWLQFPDIITYVILPLIVLTWFFKILIYEKMRIFRNEFSSWFLGALLSILMTFILKLGLIIVIIGIIGIIWFKVNNVLLRIIITVALLLILLNLNTMINLVTKGI